MKIKKILILVSIVVLSFFMGAVIFMVGGNAETAVKDDAFRSRVDSAYVFCKKNKMNTEFCILIDFSIHSGKKRFFVWDFEKDSLLYSSLCAHGYGGKSTQSTPEFSNVSGSYCSSLGRYKIGVRSYSQYGINVHYKLHGLESTNSNAFKRIIVLHSYQPVPEFEMYPLHLPLGMSQGCPVISDETMRYVDKILQKTQSPTLLWIYY